jgi:NitT/TauT family transport system substrate-binding protein
MQQLRRIAVAIFIASTMAASAAAAATAEPLVQLSVARLTLPGAITAILDPLKEKGIDRAHGIDLVVKNYSTIAAFYGATTTGEVDMSVAGPWILQRLRNEGARIVGVFTFVGISSLGVVTPDPTIKTIQDLKGKTIAADMGSAEYQLLAAYGKSQGVVFGSDVTVMQAGPPLARAQLDAGRVDAAMSWETNTTLLLHDNPKYRRVIGGETAWAGLSKSGAHGWQLLLTLHEDVIKKHPEIIPRLLAMWQDAAKFINTHTKEAEAIDAKTVALPPGVLSEALASKRLDYDIEPVWGAEKAGLWQTFGIAVQDGYIPKLPDQGVLYSP